MRRSLAGMTLIELLASIAILGMVTIFALPAFRGLQARQDMRVAQGIIQSALYRLEQLSLAPPAITQDSGEATDYDIVGYGLVFYRIPKTNYSGSVSLANCRVTASNDFMAVYKFVRFKQGNSVIQPYLMPVDPTTSIPATCALIARSYPQDIYVLPSRVLLADQASSPPLGQPWLVTQSLKSVGTSVGQLTGDASLVDPFESTNTPLLALQHTSIRVSGQPLCYGVALSRFSQSIQITNRVTEGCTDD